MTPAERSTEEPRPRRVLVALSATAGSGTLDPIAQLARRLEADLLGLFLEDPHLAAVADHGAVFVRSTLLGARSHDPELLRRVLRARMAERRRALEEAGHRVRVRTDFQIYQGGGVTAVLARAETTDVIVLGAPAADARPGGVAVVVDGSSGAERALDVAGALLGPAGGRLTVVLATARMDRAREWESGIRARLAGRQIGVEGVEMPAPTLADVARLARRRDAALLVLDRASPLLGDDAAVERAGLPILVV